MSVDATCMNCVVNTADRVPMYNINKYRYLISGTERLAAQLTLWHRLQDAPQWHPIIAFTCSNKGSGFNVSIWIKLPIRAPLGWCELWPREGRIIELNHIHRSLPEPHPHVKTPPYLSWMKARPFCFAQTPGRAFAPSIKKPCPFRRLIKMRS